MTEKNLPALFIWPESRFVRENSLGVQFAHVISEVDEVAQVMPLGFPEEAQSPAMPSDLMELCREMADLHHSLETWWRKIAAVYGWEAVRSVFTQVWEKNQNRGYYQREDTFSRDDHALSLLLFLVQVNISEDLIRQWSVDQVKQAQDWASAAYMKASDHDDIQVPEMPSFLAPFVIRNKG